MSHDSTVLERIHDHCGDVKAHIVFVHGLGGDKRKTWQSDEEDGATFWPRRLCRDLNGRERPPVGVWSLGYPAEFVQGLFFPSIRDDSVPQRANDLLDRLTGDELVQRPVIFVAHSLGGILVKQMLRSSADVRHSPGVAGRLALSTRLVLFLATPHTGSSVARLVRHVGVVGDLVRQTLSRAVDSIPVLAFVKPFLRWAVRLGPFTRALEKGDPHLEDLANWYRHNAPHAGVETRAYYETRKLKGRVIIVDKESANPGVSGAFVAPLDADHISICKPVDRNDHYQRLLAPIRSAVEDCPVFKETHLAVLDVRKRFKKLAELHPNERMMATKRVVHPIEVRLGRSRESVDYEVSSAGQGKFAVEKWQERAAATSEYDLDRVILNVWYENRGGIPDSDPAGAVRRELERLRATGLDCRKELTLIPLYYAARSLQRLAQAGKVKQLEDPALEVVKVVRGAHGVVEELAKKFEMDKDKRTRAALLEIRTAASGNPSGGATGAEALPAKVLAWAAEHGAPFTRADLMEKFGLSRGSASKLLEKLADGANPLRRVRGVVYRHEP